MTSVTAPAVPFTLGLCAAALVVAGLALRHAARAWGVAQRATGDAVGAVLVVGTLVASASLVVLGTAAVTLVRLAASG